MNGGWSWVYPKAIGVGEGRGDRLSISRLGHKTFATCSHERSVVEGRFGSSAQKLHVLHGALGGERDAYGDVAFDSAALKELGILRLKL